MVQPIFFANIFNYGSNWNFILLIIIACSIMGFTIFIERLLKLNQAEIDTNQLIIAMRKSINEGDIVNAIRICEDTGGPIANMIKSGIVKHNRPREQIESAMEMSGMIEMTRLEKNAKILSLIAYISPLIGLLGTVLGFIQAFADMRLSGLVDISATRIGEAMEYALITTAAGLVVAIPSIIAYNYIVSRIESFVFEMQICSTEIVDLLMDKQDPRYL